MNRGIIKIETFLYFLDLLSIRFKKLQIFLLVFSLLFSFPELLASARGGQETPFSKMTYFQQKELSLDQIKKMAEQGDTNAQINLAMKYLFGKEVEKNEKEGIRWYKKAANGGNSRAALYLGQYYQHTKTEGSNNMEIAIEWYSKAVELGDDFAPVMMGRLYRNGQDGFPKNLEKAVHFLEIATWNKNVTATIWLSEMYLKGEGCEKNFQKAKNLLLTLPPEVLKTNADAQRINLELTGYIVLGPETGNLEKDKIKLPAFYIWRRVYQKKGKSNFKQYFIKPDGTLAPCKDVGPSYEEWFSEKLNMRGGSGEKRDNIPQTLSSPSGNWQVVKDVKNGVAWDSKIFYKRKSEEELLVVGVPFDEWGAQLGWNPKKDLFYYWTSGGADTGRQNTYYQFDPEHRAFTCIGSGSWYSDFSPDGEWVVWVNGNGMDYSDRQLVAYNVDTNKNYVLTAGHSDNSFDAWADDPSLEQLKDVAAQVSPHIEKGRKYYLAHDFDKAILEYQKAIEINPKNSDAYGLMGYSYFRKGELDAARKALNSSAVLNPRNLMAYYNLSLVVWAQNQHLQAVYYLNVYIDGDTAKKRVVEKDPQFKELIRSEEYQKIINGDKRK